MHTPSHCPAFERTPSKSTLCATFTSNWSHIKTITNNETHQCYYANSKIFPKCFQTIFSISQNQTSKKQNSPFVDNLVKMSTISLAKTIRKDTSCLFQMKIVYNFLPCAPRVCVRWGTSGLCVKRHWSRRKYFCKNTGRVLVNISLIWLCYTV